MDVNESPITQDTVATMAEQQANQQQDSISLEVEEQFNSRMLQELGMAIKRSQI